VQPPEFGSVQKNARPFASLFASGDESTNRVTIARIVKHISDTYIFCPSTIIGPGSGMGHKDIIVRVAQDTLP
jgi:hypothetical protein